MEALSSQGNATANAGSSGALTDCPYCPSTFVQPLDWCEVDDGALRLRLWCPECRAAMSGVFDPALVIDYDKALAEGREQLVESYEACLHENLTAEADRLEQAFTLDLIGPDDFNLPRARAIARDSLSTTRR